MTTAAELPRDVIRVEDAWYVLATTSRAGDPPRVLKHGESFTLFDRFGDMPRASSGEHGLYYQGTRFLSVLELRIEWQRPILLNSSVSRDNSSLGVDLTPKVVVRRLAEPPARKGVVKVADVDELWKRLHDDAKAL